jgi:hypothetical protein
MGVGVYEVNEAEMSTMNPSTLANDRGTALQTTMSRLAGALKSPLRAVAFWTAVVLPFAYLPMLVGGLSNVTLFTTLVVANALTLLAGHNHGR